MIIGTVRNSVRMAFMDNQWQQKKASGALGKQDRNQELTPQERELSLLQEQADEIRKSRERSQIDAKLKAGEKLTADEIAYLKRNDPAALKEYEETEREREAYKRALRGCRSKEEVEKLKLTKMGSLMAQAKKTSSNPNIPKGAKKALLEKILRITNLVNKEHLEFVKTPQYRALPEKTEDEDKGRTSGPEGEMSKEQENASQEQAAEAASPEENGTDRISRENAAGGSAAESTAQDIAPEGAAQNAARETTAQNAATERFEMKRASAAAQTDAVPGEGAKAVPGEPRGNSRTAAVPGSSRIDICL